MCCAASFRDPALHMMPRFFCFDSTMPPTDTAGGTALIRKGSAIAKTKARFRRGGAKPVNRPVAGTDFNKGNML